MFGCVLMGTSRGARGSTLISDWRGIEDCDAVCGAEEKKTKRTRKVFIFPLRQWTATPLLCSSYVLLGLCVIGMTGCLAKTGPPSCYHLFSTFLPLGWLRTQGYLHAPTHACEMRQRQSSWPRSARFSYASFRYGKRPTLRQRHTVEMLGLVHFH